MKRIELGKNIEQTQGVKAFIPHPFPPKEGFDWDAHLLKKTDQATRLLGKLDGITKLLPDADFFLLMYLRKDAASSSHDDRCDRSRGKSKHQYSQGCG